MIQDKIIGFIGSGNMGSAIIGGMLKNKIAEPKNIVVSDLSIENLNKVKEKFNVNITTDNKEVASKAGIIILAVKPYIYSLVIEEIRDIIKKDVIIVSIAAGQDIQNIENLFGKDIKLVRVMPNTPALVGEGMSALSPNSLVTKEELEEILKIFNSFGVAETVPESLMNAVIAVSGSSPAYIYMIIEALADGAVLDGMPRDKAYKFASQAVLGSAKMVLETGKHPGELKDMVCSPGGTTIAAVAKLEETGLKSSILEGMKACTRRSIEMTENK